MIGVPLSTPVGLANGNVRDDRTEEISFPGPDTTGRVRSVRLVA